MKISLRKVNFSDIEFLWYLRNQPDVYKYSRVNRAVSWKEHIKWIMPIILKTAPKNLFIIQKKLLPISNIYKENLKEIWNGKKMREIRQQLTSKIFNPICQKCLYFRDKYLVDKIS